VASRERETNARARGCKSRRTTRINHAGRELFLATSSFNSAGRPAEGARPGPRATGIPAWNSSVIAPYDSRGNFFRRCVLSHLLEPARSRLATAFLEIKRGSAIATALPCPLPPAPAWCRSGRVFPSKRDYISLQCALSILSYILQRTSGTETWTRRLIGSVSERTVSGQRTRLSLFLFVPCSLPDGRTDGRTDGRAGSRGAITILSSLICEHSARISLLHGALCTAERGRCTY